MARAAARRVAGLRELRTDGVAFGPERERVGRLLGLVPEDDPAHAGSATWVGEDWAEIRRLHRAEGMPVKAIARVMKVSRNTVRAALASDRPPRHERPARRSIVDGAEPRIQELLRVYPAMPARR
jgi:hypothetical protein